jgi:hypothetical protein
MSLDSVLDVNLLLTCAQITISAWVPDVCDNDDESVESSDEEVSC